MSEETAGDFICLDCGVKTGERYYTFINKVGPYCLPCLESADDEEIRDNGQFGVGA